MFQLDLLCHTGILGVDGRTNWDLVFCWVEDFGPKRPFPYDWRLANENDENEHSLQQVDNVIENKIFPDFVSATDPRQDEAKKFREPSDAHNDKNLKNHFEVVAVSLSARRNPKLFAWGPFIYYVSIFLESFDHSSLFNQKYNIESNQTLQFLDPLLPV